MKPDSTKTQRKGIKTGNQVSPSINGTKGERDELLEKAVETINEK